jgi:Holliday junction resolvase RusA-like endonuclease
VTSYWSGSSCIVWIPGAPVGKARPRVTRAGRTYTPAKTAEHEDKIRLEAAAVASMRATDGKPLAPMQGPLICNILCAMPIPKSWTKARREDARRFDRWHTSKPDADNLAKAVLDALNGILYEDDSQVVMLAVTKRYAKSEPGTMVTLSPA